MTELTANVSITCVNKEGILYSKLLKHYINICVIDCNWYYVTTHLS